MWFGVICLCLARLRLVQFSLSPLTHNISKTTRCNCIEVYIIYNMVTMKNLHGKNDIPIEEN